jgi:ATP/maltotriose-dependent transcriptional regulator MalT
LDAVRRQHAGFFQSFAERLETAANVGGPGRPAAHAAIEQEQDNLRAALHWCLERGEAQMGLRLGRAHWNFWVVRGRYTEGRSWLTRLAALPEAKREPVLRATALTITASLTWRQGSYAAAQELCEEAVPLLRPANDPWPLANAVIVLAFIALYQGNYQAAVEYFEEALAAWRAAGDRVNEAIALSNLGRVALAQAEYAAGCARCKESLALSRAVGDPWAVAIALSILGYVMLRQGDLATARRLLEEGLVLRRQVGERWGLAFTLDALGRVALAEGHYAEAQTVLCESLRLRHELGDRLGMADSLESIAALSAAEAGGVTAIELAGAAASLREAIGAPLDPNGRAMLDHWLFALRQVLGETATTLAWEAGRSSSLDQAVELALAATESPPTRSTRPSGRSEHGAALLSPREQEVAALLTHQLSNRQIAGQLVVTERTVAAHMEHILDKLGFASRHQVAAWAAEHGLLG